MSSGSKLTSEPIFCLNSLHCSKRKSLLPQSLFFHAATLHLSSPVVTGLVKLDSL